MPYIYENEPLHFYRVPSDLSSSRNTKAQNYVFTNFVVPQLNHVQNESKHTLLKYALKLTEK